MEEILINNQSFKAIQVVDLTDSAETPEQRVEDGFSVVDTIILKPKEFSLTLELMEDEVELLKQLYESKQPIEFVCRFGAFEDIVIKELHITQGGSANTYRASISLKQILKAKAKTAAIPLHQLQVTPDEKDAKGGDTTISPQAKQVPQAPEQPQENQSWLDSIVTFLGGFLGFGGG